VALSRTWRMGGCNQLKTVVGQELWQNHLEWRCEQQFCKYGDIGRGGPQRGQLMCRKGKREGRLEQKVGGVVSVSSMG
jgi:hypothetical protein